MRFKLQQFVALLIWFVPTVLPAQDEDIAELSSIAEKFVAAYNAKDLEAIGSLYTSRAELVDNGNVVYASGSEEIEAVFEKSFTELPDRKAALDVLSVREISDGVVIEEGIAYFSDESDESDFDVVSYSAVLVEEEGNGWLIASSRELRTEEESPDLISELYSLVGDWILHGDQLVMTLSLDLTASGNFLVGNARTTTPDEGDMTTDIRIGVDPSSGQVYWWTFDEAGGFAQGNWQKSEDGWLVQTNGTSAEGEKTSAVQNLTFENEDTIVWSSTHRFIAGEGQPDAQLRLVRRPPEPSLNLSNANKDEPAAADSKE